MGNRGTAGDGRAVRRRGGGAGPEAPDLVGLLVGGVSHRIDARSKPELVGPARGDVVTSLCARPGAPGVLGDDGEVVVGWAAVTRAGEYVGAGALFERAGFAMVADTTAVSGGFFRMVMRLELRR